MPLSVHLRAAVEASGVDPSRYPDLASLRRAVRSAERKHEQEKAAVADKEKAK